MDSNNPEIDWNSSFPGPPPPIFTPEKAENLGKFENPLFPDSSESELFQTSSCDIPSTQPDHSKEMNVEDYVRMQLGIKERRKNIRFYARKCRSNTLEPQSSEPPHALQLEMPPTLKPQTTSSESFYQNPPSTFSEIQRQKQKIPISVENCVKTRLGIRKFCGRKTEMETSSCDIPPTDHNYSKEMNAKDRVKTQLGIERRRIRGFYARKYRSNGVKPQSSEPPHALQLEMPPILKPQPTTSESFYQNPPSTSSNIQRQPKIYRISRISNEMNVENYLRKQLGIRERFHARKILSNGVESSEPPHALQLEMPPIMKPQPTTSESFYQNPPPSTSSKILRHPNIYRIPVSRGPNGEIIPKPKMRDHTYAKPVVFQGCSIDEFYESNKRAKKRVEASRPNPFIAKKYSGPSLMLPTEFHPGFELAHVEPGEVKEEEPEQPPISELMKYKRNFLSTIPQRPPSPLPPPAHQHPFIPSWRPPSFFPIFQSQIPKNPQKFIRKSALPHEDSSKSPSPPRIFLGAEEPMKDLEPPGMKTKRVEIKKVDFLNVEWNNEGEFKSVDLEEDKNHPTAKHQEFLRRKRAFAQKPFRNERQIREYMQSDEFSNTLNSESPTSSEFEKAISGPNAYSNIPEYSDSLRKTNPVLYHNLLDIHRGKKKKTIIPRRIQKRKNEELQELMKNVDQIEFPLTTQCHLCGFLMRLQMRVTVYKGEKKTSQAYRCQRKGCQTFRSIKNYLESTLSLPKTSITPLENEEEIGEEEDVKPNFEDIKLEEPSEEPKPIVENFEFFDEDVKLEEDSEVEDEDDVIDYSRLSPYEAEEFGDEIEENNYVVDYPNERYF